MNELRETYITIERYLFPMLEEEFDKFIVKQKEFVRVVELVRPSRFIGVNLRWSGMRIPMSGRLSGAVHFI